MVLGRRWLGISLMAWGLLGGGAEQLPGLVLAQDGQARVKIVVADQAGERVQETVQDLARCLEKMSGTRFEVVHQVGEEEPAILVGSMPETLPLVEHLRERKAPADSFLIRCQGPRLYLVGSDYDMRAHTYPDEGTCNAVYTLLHEFGCRWYFPTELGEVIPQRDLLEVREQDRYIQPSFWYRGSIWYQGWGGEEWMRRNRGGGLDLAFTGHSYMQLVPPSEYEETNPEYYMLKDGQRRPGWGLCTSNPQVVQIAAETIKERLRKTGLKLVPVTPPDTSDMCECEPCRAIDPPEIRQNLTQSQLDRIYGNYIRANTQTKSDRVLDFANKVAREVRGEFPEARILVFGYWSYMHAPLRVKPEPNVIHWFTLWTTTGVKPGYAFSEPGNETAQKVFLDNAALYSDMMLYAYYGSWTIGTYHPLHFHIARDLPWFHRHGAHGFMSETHPQWLGQGLNFYTMYRVSWDVDTDVEQMWEEYYRDLFGPAAEEMQAFDQIVYNAYISHPRAREPGMYIPDTQFLTELVLQQMRVMFNRARVKARGNEMVGKRLAFFGKGLEIAEYWCRAHQDMDTARRIGSPVLARRALDSLGQIERLFQQPGYSDGFNMGSYWGNMLKELRPQWEALLEELETDRE